MPRPPQRSTSDYDKKYKQHGTALGPVDSQAQRSEHSITDQAFFEPYQPDLSLEGQTLPTLGATSTSPPPRPRLATANNGLSISSDVFTTGSGSETDNSGYGGFGTEPEAEKLIGEDTYGRVEKTKVKKGARKVAVDDFERMRVLGKGFAGEVLLVRHRASSELYALKAITKRHVLAHQELQHNLTEQAVLKRMARESRDPFVVKLWWSFHDRENLFLVMDFHPGGDLATQLARWGRFGRDRTRFYAAEIVEGCEGLHAAGVIYRDLKPENVLIDASGHIVLTDFGLSKEFPRKHNGHSPVIPRIPHWMDAVGSSGRTSTSKRLDRDMTSTFCGTPEYLAPEVIRGLPYSYEVDWWSFGTMLYEMLTGITPFWANNHSDMYVRVLQDELQFPNDKAMDQDTKSLVRGLLQRNPALRICEPRVKKHPYFSMIDWQHVYYKRYIPPYIPPIDPANAGDAQNFDEAFLDMVPAIADETAQADLRRKDLDPKSAYSISGGVSPELPNGEEERAVGVFEGYPSEGRDSVIVHAKESSKDEGKGGERTRTPEVLEPEVGDGPIVVNVLQATRDPISTDLPEIPDETFGLPEPKPVVPTTPMEDVSTPKPVVDKPALAPETKTATPVARTKQKREKAGVTPFDRILDESDDDWDMVEKPRRGDVAYNGRTSAGAKPANNLFARGVVDKYSLTVFRKSTRPALSKVPQSSGTCAADTNMNPGDTVGSPTSSDTKYRRLSLRQSTKQFLRAKSPSTAGGSSSSGQAQLASLAAGRAAGAVNTGSGPLSPASSVPYVPSLEPNSSALLGVSSALLGPSDPVITETPGPSGLQPIGDPVGTAPEAGNSNTLRRKSLTAGMSAEPPIDEGKKIKKSRKSGTGKLLALFTLDATRSYDTGSKPPVSGILASPSMQQAIASPLLPETPEPFPPPQRQTALPGVEHATPTSPEGQTLQAAPTLFTHRTNVIAGPAGNYLSTGTEAVVSGSGSEACHSVFGGLGTETDIKCELDPGTDLGTLIGEDTLRASNVDKMAAPKVVVDDSKMMRTLEQQPDMPLRHSNKISPCTPISPQVAQSVLMSKIMSGMMSSEEMFQHLVDHGCVDLSLHMDPNQYSEGLIVGGGFGDIWKGKLRNGTVVAIKVWRFCSIQQYDPKSMKRAMREIYYWSKAKHKNIQELMGVIMFQGRLGMVSQWMDQGNLREYLYKYPYCDRYSF